MATYEEILQEKSLEIEAIKTANGGDGLFASVNNVRREFTDEEYEDHKVLVAQIQFDRQENGYIQDRALNYPPLVEFIEAYTEKEILADSTKWDAYVVKYNQVRSDYPKPA
jgi:hypothetical protein